MFKKIYTTLFLAICFVMGAAGQTYTLTPATDFESAIIGERLTAVYKSDGTISASFGDKFADIKSALGITSTIGESKLYTRWLIKDKASGTYTMANLENANITITTSSTGTDPNVKFFDTNYGLVSALKWYYNTESEFYQASISVLALTEETSSNYEIVCLLATGYNHNSSNVTEPTIKYIVPFDIKTEAQIAESFTPATEPTSITASTTVAVANIQNFSVGSIYSNLLKSHIENAIANSKQCYFRWYLADADGNPITDASITSTTVSGDYHALPSTVNNAHGVYYNLGTATNTVIKDDGGRTDDTRMSNVLDNMTITSSSATDGCKVILLVADENAHTTAGIVTGEPTFDYKFEITVKDRTALENSYTFPTTLPTTYEKTNVIESESYTSYTIDLSRYISDINAEYNYGDYSYNSTQYLHLYLQTRAGENSDWTTMESGYDSNTFTANGNLSGINYTGTKGLFAYNTDPNKLGFDNHDNMKFTFTKPTSIDWANVRVIAILNDWFNDGCVTLDNGVVTSEVINNMKMAFAISFMTKSEVENAYTLPTAVPAEAKQCTIYIDINSNATINLADFADGIDLGSIKYVHWYLLDAEDKALDGSDYYTTFTTTASGTTSTNSKGHFVYNNNGLGLTNASSFTFGLPNVADTDWSKYKLVAMLADDLANFGLADEYVISEPTIDNTLVFSFKDIQEIMAKYEFPEDISGVGGNLHEKAELISDPNSTTLSLDLNKYKMEIGNDFWGNIWGIQAIKYFHLFLQEKDAEGNWVNCGDLSSTTFTGNNNINGFNYSGPKGFFAYNTGSEENDHLFNIEWNENEALMFSYGLRYTFNKPEGKNWKDLRLVVMMTDDCSGLTFDGNYVMSDHTGMKSVYTIQFVTQENIKFTMPKRIDENATEITLQRRLDEPLSINLQQIGSIDLTEVKYIHWYLADAQTGEILSNNENIYYTTFSTSVNGTAINNELGYFTYNYSDNLGLNNEPTSYFHFPLPYVSGNTWKDYKLVAQMATDTEGLNVVGNYLLTGPNTTSTTVVFSFEEPVLPSITVDPIGSNRHDYTYVVDNDSEAKLTHDLLRYRLEVTRDYGTGSDYLQTKYLHLYLVNANDESLIKEVYSGISPTPKIPDGEHPESTMGEYAHTRNEGYICYNQNGNLPMGFFDLYFDVQKPEGKNWTDMKLVAAFTDDLTGMEMTDEYSNILQTLPTNIKSWIVISYSNEASHTFKHYEGIANAEGEWENAHGKQYQKTHIHSYNKYVKDGETITLRLPVQEVAQYPDQGEGPLYDDEGNLLMGGNGDEHKAYARWYDYETDALSARLSTNDDKNKGEVIGALLKTDINIDGTNNSAGHMYIYNAKDSVIRGTYYDNMAAVNYTASWSGEGEGDIIACDLSRYADGLDESNSYLLHEPTLSIRYIYNVYPATNIADALKNAIAMGSGNVLENHGYVSIGVKDVNSTANLRVDLQEVGDYYFYNYKYSDSEVPAGSTSEQILAQFDNTLLQATDITWRVFDASGKFYKDLSYSEGDDSNHRMYPVSISKLNEGEWKALDGSSNTSKYQFSIGDIAYIIAYAVNGESKCPVARFTCRFHGNNYPVEFTELNNSAYNYRTLSYLAENFHQVAVIDYNNDNEGLTLAPPTDYSDNMTHKPSAWERRNYGFIYYDLYDRMIETGDYVWYNWYQDRWYDQHPFIGGGTGVAPVGLGALHGDYALYKSIGLDGVSPNYHSETHTAHNYTGRWYCTDELHDRTYQMTGGAQSGYFLYVDASDEARQIGEADFQGELCPGSTIVISAAVANRTNEDATKPQLMFHLYGVDDSGSRHLIHSFATCDFETVGATKEGPWYQVYIRTSLQTGTGVENFNNFVMAFDNYCDNTAGADYAIDDIRIYTRNSKIDVVQNQPMCNDEDGAVFKMRSHYETLTAWMGAYQGWGIADGTQAGQKNLYWRVYKEPVDGSSAAEPVTGIYGDSENDYGKVTIYRVIANATDEYREAHVEYDEAGEAYFVLDTDINLPKLEEGWRYYVAFARDDNEGNLDASTWSSPTDICSAYSDYFTTIGQGVEIYDSNTEVISNFPLPCGIEEATVNMTGALTIPDPVNGGSVRLSGDDIQFEWYVILKKEGADDKQIRVYGGTAASSIEFQYKESEHLSDDGYLHLQLVPTTQTATVEGTEVTLCTNPVDIDLRAIKGGPELNLGFKDVFYTAGTDRVVRLGLEQLREMSESGAKLVIPVNSYKSYYDNEGFSIKIPAGDDGASDDALEISDTNDPTCQIGTRVATVKSISVDNVVLELSKDIFNDNANVFNEGYWYEVNLRISEDDESGNPCLADVYFTMKIVPEYITWTGAADLGLSDNWNNDLNWQRSYADYIYKPAGYADYTGELSHQQSYVPMKFTKVTINPNIQSPSLKALSRTGEGIVVDRDLLNGDGHDATDDIQYDLMVRIADELDQDFDGDKTNDYDCEKWYGNTCAEIYFKPQAELLYQQHLVYNRAWVEYELEQNKWYMLTSPLKEVYAGDMYVPANISGVTKGRQETPAFQDINFDVTNGYSRTQYPIYQRSWDKSGSMVITPTGDDYDAFIDSYSWVANGELTEHDIMQSQWSHTYNDMSVGYTPDGNNENGFSLRPNKVDDNANKALIRIPKADTEYTYYYYDDKDNHNQDNARKEPVNKTEVQNLYVDHKSTSTTVTMPLSSNESEGNGYYLVSNPYMASISMRSFFAANTGLAPTFWIVSAGNMHTCQVTETQDYTIAPTQAFFVKKAEGAEVSDVTFTTNMITSQRYDLEKGTILSRTAKFTEAAMARKSVQRVTMTAAYQGRKSAASIIVKSDATEDYDDTEDASTLYDSNLSDVPTLYTVAGYEAVSVNTLPEITLLPMGVVCNEDVEATIQVSGMSTMQDDIYLYDRETGTSTLLADGVDVTVKTNQHGRYFITNQDIKRTVTVHADGEEGVKCYSPAPGLLTVTCTGAGDTIEAIDLYTIDGKKTQSVKDIHLNSTTIHTHKGVTIVVIKHTANDQAVTAKVAVK